MYYFIYGSLQAIGFVPELTPYVDVGGFGPHGKTYNQSAFNEFVWIASQDLSVLAGTGFGLIGVNDEIAWSLFGRDFGHEGVFESRGETCASSASQA